MDATSETLVNVLNRHPEFPGFIISFQDLPDGRLELTIRDKESGIIETQTLSFLEQVLLVDGLMAGIQA